jgi:hypothetical protein
MRKARGEDTKGGREIYINEKRAMARYAKRHMEREVS